MPRFFTRDQAEQTLPAVEKAIRDAIFRKAEYLRTETELRETTRRIMMAGGMMLDREHIGEVKRIREDSVKRLDEGLELIQTHGCQVKDLDVGLLDFPTLYKGEEVCLCWRLGEERIGFWHGIGEGFPGRKPINEEFLLHHNGDVSS